MQNIRAAIVAALAYCRIVRVRLLDRAPDEELTQCTNYTERQLQDCLDEIDAESDGTTSKRANEIARDAIASLRYALNLVILGRPLDAAEIEYLRTVCDNQEKELNEIDHDAPPTSPN